MSEPLRKYPRTPHILDSRLQLGDEDLHVAEFGEIAGRHLVIEEKLDGSNTAISFDMQDNLLLQSRGHYLMGGPRERHFDLFKSWAASLRTALLEVLGHRYVMYGEWLYAKHTIFYDRLPHYFLEFDVLDREHSVFLSTARRQQLLANLPIVSAPVLHEGVLPSAEAAKNLVAPSRFKSPNWRDTLCEAARESPHKPELVLKQTDGSDLMEGLYLKVEEDGVVSARYKYVRADFLSVVADSESHWQSRPILKNRLETTSQRVQQP